jgi:uncharacterized pyridoxamine 5'-phosphate oxidase family protein
MNLQERINQLLKTEDSKSLFYINRNNKYCFKDFFPNNTIEEMYIKHGEDIIEFLDNLYDNASFKDKINIKEIKLLLKNII